MNFMPTKKRRSLWFNAIPYFAPLLFVILLLSASAAVAINPYAFAIIFSFLGFLLVYWVYTTIRSLGDDRGRLEAEVSKLRAAIKDPTSMELLEEMSGRVRQDFRAASYRTLYFGIVQSVAAYILGKVVSTPWFKAMVPWWPL